MQQSLETLFPSPPLLAGGVYHGDYLIGGQRFVFAVTTDGNFLTRICYSGPAEGATAVRQLRYLLAEVDPSSGPPPAPDRPLFLLRD